MRQPENKHLLRLLVKVYNCLITDYYYFPEIIFAGTKKIERDDFHALLSEGFIAVYKYDSFGRYYRHTKKCETVFHEQLARKQQHRKTPAVPLIQGCLYFSRQKNKQASGAKCLAFF